MKLELEAQCCKCRSKPDLLVVWAGRLYCLGCLCESWPGVAQEIYDYLADYKGLATRREKIAHGLRG